VGETQIRNKDQGKLFSSCEASKELNLPVTKKSLLENYLVGSFGPIANVLRNTYWSSFWQQFLEIWAITPMGIGTTYRNGTIV